MSEEIKDDCVMPVTNDGWIMHPMSACNIREVKSTDHIYFSKIRDVKTPTRGTTKSAGIDFYIPNYSGDFLEALFNKNPHLIPFNNTKSISIIGRNDILIPSGIKYRGIKDTALIAFNKSGVAVKNKLICGACVIDEDYQGEIHLHLINTSDSTVTLEYGQKILQFILLPIFYPQINIVDDSDIHPEETERGSGGFGSTNK